MSTIVHHQGKLVEVDLFKDLFEAEEGTIDIIYGRIGQGKTYGATADVLDELSRGHVVYVNWKMNYKGFDQRDSLIHVLGSILFPWKNKLFYFPPENLHYLPIDDNFMNTFEKLTDCSVYLDEGHVVFDSYEMAKMSMQKRTSVLHTRHFNRSIHIISQRPTAIHRMMRANVNRFYKYDKLIGKPIMLFRRTEFQDMQDENVDETQPLSTKYYLGSKKVFNMYDSKYLRGNTPDSQKVHFDGFKLSITSRIYLLLRKIALSVRGLMRRTDRVDT